MHCALPSMQCCQTLLPEIQTQQWIISSTHVMVHNVISCVIEAILAQQIKASIHFSAHTHTHTETYYSGISDMSIKSQGDFFFSVTPA